MILSILLFYIHTHARIITSRIWDGFYLHFVKAEPFWMCVCAHCTLYHMYFMCISKNLIVPQISEIVPRTIEKISNKMKLKIEIDLMSMTSVHFIT